MQYKRLVSERERLQQELIKKQDEVQVLRSLLSSDQATLLLSTKNSQVTLLLSTKNSQDVIFKLTIDNERKEGLVQTMQRRVEEESEVIDAVRSQLYDYRQMVMQLQGQLKRGKNKPVLGPGAGGSLPSHPSKGLPTMDSVPVSPTGGGGGGGATRASIADADYLEVDTIDSTPFHPNATGSSYVPSRLSGTMK
eukprot:gene23590-9118_t